MTANPLVRTRDITREWTLSMTSLGIWRRLDDHG